MVSRKKKSGDHQVGGLNPLRTINVCAKLHSYIHHLKSINIILNEIKAALPVCFPPLGTLQRSCLLEPLGGFPQVERQSLVEMPLCHPAHKFD